MSQFGKYSMVTTSAIWHSIFERHFEDAMFEGECEILGDVVSSRIAKIEEAAGVSLSDFILNPLWEELEFACMDEASDLFYNNDAAQDMVYEAAGRTTAEEFGGLVVDYHS